MSPSLPGAVTPEPSLPGAGERPPPSARRPAPPPRGRGTGQYRARAGPPRGPPARRGQRPPRPCWSPTGRLPACSPTLSGSTPPPRYSPRAADWARAAREVVLDAYDEGLDALELRFSPWFIHSRTGLAPEAVIDAVAGGVAEACALTGLPVGLIGILLRDLGPDSALPQLDSLLRAPGSSARSTSPATRPATPPGCSPPPTTARRRGRPAPDRARRRGRRAGIGVGRGPLPARRAHRARRPGGARTRASWLTWPSTASPSRSPSPATCRPGRPPATRSTRCGRCCATASRSRSTPTTRGRAAPRWPREYDLAAARAGLTEEDLAAVARQLAGRQLPLTARSAGLAGRRGGAPPGPARDW